MTETPRRAALAFILITVTLDMLALGVIVPVLPRLVVDFVGGDTARGAAIYGLFVFVQTIRHREDFLVDEAPAAYKLPELTAPDEFFGGQVTIDVFGPAAQKIPIAYESQYDGVLREPFVAELSNVETKGKDPETAWKDAVTASKQAGERVGVS